MILVLGATGTTGGEVARQLVAAGERPRLLVRSPDKARGQLGAIAERAELAQGDLDDPESLRRAMEGVDRLYLVSTGLDLARLEANAVDAAKAAGVRRVVKLSVLGADDPPFAFAREHQASEAHLRASGLAWTMLRPGNFASNALGWAPTVKAQGQFYQPSGEGRWAAIDPADIGAVAVRALVADGHEGRAYEMTGPESMDAAGYAAALSEAVGRPVRFVDVPEEAARGQMLGGGMPAAYVDALLELMRAMRANAFDRVAPGVEEALGRPATPFVGWARRNAAAFQ